MKHTTREQWLLAMVAKLRPAVEKAAGKKLPKIRVSVGYPLGSRGGSRSNAIGQCFQSVAASDGSSTLFISPELSEATRVADVLLHELVHAIDDCKSAHGPEFRRIATACGLTGQMTATIASDPLKETLAKHAKALGAYPHAQVDLFAFKRAPKGPDGKPLPGATPEPRRGTPKQTTRMVKCVCDDCGYVVRTTRKWLEIAHPTCTPCQRVMTSALNGG
jgi:hypothetical protein